MKETKQTNSVVIHNRILIDSKDKLHKISKLTYRGIGDTLDWIIAEAWKKFEKQEQPK